MSRLVAALQHKLQSSGADYECDSRLNGTHARLRFIGRFAGQAVVWDAEVEALGKTRQAEQFIEISAPSEQGLKIHIGLGVACIDRPTLLKTIIMVRNYKRLSVGRHAFGPRDNR